MRLIIEMEVPSPIFDIDHERACAWKEQCKIELLIELCKQGFRPLNDLAGDQFWLQHDSERIFSLSMVSRSKSYLLALLAREGIYQRGLVAIHQAGPHAYYQVLLTTEDLSALNAIPDIATTPNETFVQMLKGDAGDAALAVADEGADTDLEGEAPAPAALVPLAPVPAAAVAMPGAQTFVFPCHTHEGDKPLRVSVDGWSHQSGKRRVYADCVQPGHVKCRHYKFVHHFSEPWQAVAHIVLYVRAGALTENKREHFQLPAPTALELESVRGEMPPDVFELLC